MIYCPKCGAENDRGTEVCRECHEAIPPKENLFLDFLIQHTKDAVKDKVSDKVFDVLRNWLLSHLYASVVTVSVVAVVATGAVTLTNNVQKDDLSERPASVSVSLLSPEEQTLFEENSKHRIFAPEEYSEVWKPAALKHTIMTEKDSCYGWVVVRDMRLKADDLFNGYNEIYVCPGVTVTVVGDLYEKKGFTDFYVAEGGTLIFDGNVRGGACICNDGKTVVNGDLEGGSSKLSCNRGDMTVTGEFRGAQNIYSFRGATVTGTDHTDHGIRYYDIDASDLYEGCSGENGMFIAVNLLE